MNTVVAQIYSCNKLTYKDIYKDAIALAYLKIGRVIDKNLIKMKIVDLSKGDRSIQQQRAPSGEHCRVIQVYEENKLVFIIGVSNTNYDEDIREERQRTGRNNAYGRDNYHANTYLTQGINKIFERYFELKKENADINLFFYLLDTDKSYPHNKYNLFTYRMLATLGFDILNSEQIDFSSFYEYGFVPNKSCTNLAYSSFNKLMNDKLAISKNNSGNIPAYLKCYENYDEDGVITTEKYIYVFKVLGAQAYECFLTIWTLYTLALKEGKNIEFELSQEHYGFRIPGREIKTTSDFTTPIKRLFELIGIEIKYKTGDEILQEHNHKISQYERAKANNDLRNQLLFRNNIRKKGILTRCPICGCDIEDALEAAHLWGVSQIKSIHGKTILKILSDTALSKLIDEEHPYKDDIFYKRYVLANSGDNGIWLCRNHHGLFDNNYFCFDSEFGKIVVRCEEQERIKRVLNVETLDEPVLTPDILTDETKIFLEKRFDEYFKDFAVV